MAPTYVEGQPLFDIVQAKAAYLRRQRLCLFSDKDGSTTGAAAIIDNENTEWVKLRYGFKGPYIPYVLDTATFEMEQGPCGLDRDRHLVKCPACAKRISKLIFSEHVGLAGRAKGSFIAARSFLSLRLSLRNATNLPAS